MQEKTPEKLALIAGKGAYPLLLAQSARRQGVDRIAAVAFRGETNPSLAKLVDELRWIHLGQYGRMLEALSDTGAAHAVMAGQITPTALFRVRFDARLIELLRSLPSKNAHTIFGAVADDLRELGIELLPAHRFMQAHMAEAGLLTRRAPTEAEQRDIALGRRIAKATSSLEIGQTVAVKDGTVLAVEAFEGTDRAIRRAGRLGGRGAVVVKVAKQGHDMRFDIPVVGLKTVRVLRRARAAVLAVEAGGAILLEKEKVVERADRLGLCLVVMPREED